MMAPLLATKLYIPSPRPKVVDRPRLVERLNEGLHRKLTLISAPAGFGKSTLLSEWVANSGRPVVWLSLDEGDNDPTRFLAYLIAALQTIPAHIGGGLLGMLQSPQPPPLEAILTALLNEITTIGESFALVLDDYHLIDAKPVDKALTFLLEHLPPQMHIVIATREDPDLPLARLRAQDQLTELRAADLRFTPAEAASFLNRVMGLALAPEEIAALETRTEGWIAGLQLAAISMQGHKDAASFIKSFTGSHHFVMDYLVEEVLQRQPASVQTFLVRTSVLDRLCGPLCDAVLLDPESRGKETLEYLERANLFLVPLDNERRWYRYHHLFADLLRQRLGQTLGSSTAAADRAVAEYHIRASVWYEANGLQIEAFRHAAAANDVERAERLIDGKGIPLHLLGAVTLVVAWLASLPVAVRNRRPSLWWRYGSLLLITGQTTGVEEKLQAAETALLVQTQGAEPDDEARDLLGQIAAARSVLALTRYQPERMITESRRALEYLHPDNRTARTTALWTLGYAYLWQKDRAAASRTLTEAITLGQASGEIFTTILATIGIGNLQEAGNQLHLAAQTYRRVLQLAGDQPLQVISEAHLGLARLLYQWNDLDGAEHHGRQSLELARQYERVIDRFVNSELFLGLVSLARGDLAGAAAIVAQAGQSARQQNFVHRLPEVAAVQVLTLLRQSNLAGAAALAQTHASPINQARVHLAKGDASAALATLEPWRRQAEANGWEDERLQAMVLQAVALQAHGERAKAVQLLGEALALALPGGFIRLFIDEGRPMVRLLSEVAAQGIMPDYVAKLLVVFEAEQPKSDDPSVLPSARPLIEPLSQRELEILLLIAHGLSNAEISERLFLALDTVKGHNRKIFGKLQVQRRTEAVARARELGLL